MLYVNYISFFQKLIKLYTLHTWSLLEYVGVLEYVNHTSIKLL